jgi:hypothetical protein
MSKWIGGGLMALGVMGFFQGDMRGAGQAFVFGALIWAFWDSL